MNALRALSSFTLVLTLVLGASMFPAHAGDDLATIFSGGHNVAPDVLAHQRGGTSPSIDANAIANVSNNLIIGESNTGDNKVLGSFNNSSGLFTVFQNSGNNVAMQSQTILNVNLQ